jgi:outer membrane lipoprotein-sorting protein
MHPRTKCDRVACLLAGAILWWPAAPAVANDAEEVLSFLSDMEKTWARVVDYTKRVEKTERLVDGDVTEQVIAFKYRQPGDFYMKVLEGPNKGGELIYPVREGSELAVAHAGGFKGGLARFLLKTRILSGIVPTEFALDDPEIGDWQHQAVPDTSIGATIAQIAGNVRRAVENGEGAVGLVQDCADELHCQVRLDFEFPPHAGVEHEVRDGETLWTIASSYGRPMYVVWYGNRDVKGPRKLRPGQTLFIPTYYAARGSVWISPDSLVPARIEIFDADGELYERYVYSDVQLNVGLTDRDFDTTNPDYRF